MNDVVVECLIKKKTTAVDVALKVLIVVVAVVLVVLMFVVGPMLGVLIQAVVTVGAVYGGYQLLHAMGVEYEYIFINGEMDIDKIMGRSRRKQVLSFDCDALEDLGEYHAGQNIPGVQTKLFYGDDPNSANLWYFLLNRKETGKTLIIVTMSDKLKTAMIPHIKGQLRLKMH